MVYHLFEGEGGTSAQNLPPLAPLLDLVIGNVDGAREPGYPDPTWAAPVLKESETTQCNHDHDCEVQAVETRQMKKRKEMPIRPLQVPSPIAEVSAEEFLLCRREIKP